MTYFSLMAVNFVEVTENHLRSDLILRKHYFLHFYSGNILFYFYKNIIEMYWQRI